MTETLLRRRKVKMYRVTPSGDDYYAFWSDGRAGLYKDGVFVSYRSTAGPEIPEPPTLIHEDSEELVGPGSIAFRVDATHLLVWDVDGETTHAYEALDGWPLTPPVYDAGWLWWMEREPEQHGGTGTHATFVRLRRARADFSDAETVQTHELEHYLGFSVDWDVIPIARLALTAEAAILQLHWNDAENGEVQDEIQVRLERDGIGASDSGWPVIAPSGTLVAPWPLEVAPPTAGGLAAGVGEQGDALTFAGLEDDVAASPEALWPEDAQFQLVSATHVSLSADGTEAAVFGSAVGGPPTLVRAAAAEVFSGAPTARFTVGDSPDEDSPHFFFIKG
jgi:hypothetical protein